jgi:hypothetical protein
LMSFTTKTFTEIALVCYLMVSSIALVHAMPMSLAAAAAAVVVNSGLQPQPDATQAQAMPACHQIGATPKHAINAALHADSGELQTASNVSCEAVCAAMANLITSPHTLALAQLESPVDPVFIGSILYSHTSAIDPHPPK